MNPPPSGPSTTPLPEWRLIVDGACDPSWNMAVDEVLLDGACGRPTVRLYSWKPSAVSLGRFQKTPPPGTPAHVPVVRRPTGGGAVFHENEATFAIVCDCRTPPLSGGRLQAYRMILGAISAALSALDIEVEPWEGPMEGQSGFCFERRAVSDLLHGGRKLVGTAQRRTSTGLLIHGSIPMETNALAPTGTSVREAAGRSVALDEVMTHLARGFETTLGVHLVPARLTPEEEHAAHLRCEAARVLPRRQGWGVPSPVRGQP